VASVEIPASGREEAGALPQPAFGKYALGRGGSGRRPPKRAMASVGVRPAARSYAATCACAAGAETRRSNGPRHADPLPRG